jgi:putative PIN family toxin of toxin-antitoxin system
VRVVLDTNIVVSALLFPTGQVTWLRDLWTARRILPLVCRATVRELIRVLAYPKFGLEEDDIQAVLGAYLPLTETVDVTDDPMAGLPLCRDPHDQVFLVLALVGRAEVLVSGDIALRELGGQLPFAIEAPAEFRRRFHHGL